MDRLFLDANILFSASYRKDAGVAVLWSMENAILYASPYVIEEARRNLVERDRTKRLERLIQSLHLVQAVAAPEALQLPDAVPSCAIGSLHRGDTAAYRWLAPHGRGLKVSDSR